MVPDGRNTPQQERQPPNGRSTPQNAYYTPQPESTTITPPPQAHIGESIPRSQTSFSEAPTLVRKNSNSSAISNRSGPKPSGSSPPREESVMRSIFPRYNPEIALEHQAYYPTQTSPTHIPTTIINRRPYSPSINDRSPGFGGLQSPMNVTSPGRFPRGLQDESILEPSHTEELKELWKVVNGWRVSVSEGRRFCLKMTSAPEEPVHTLSSSTQPFYTLKLIPTSTSAQMTMSRHDPNKLASSPKIGSASKDKGMEVMSTALEETARRLPPNDGLVALLYPKAASDMVIDLANKSPDRVRADSDQVVAAAERECGRLVWDEDSGKYYLVHPAISTPFIVSISSSPAWSRVEYTLEHPELPRNIVRLIRDGAGSGFLEIDTGVAAKIDCFYIVDVAICAILLVATAEEKNHNVERFDAPPSIVPMSPHSRRNSGISVWGKVKAKKEKAAPVKVEEFELDLESQDSLRSGEKGKKEKKEKVPGCCGLLWMLIKCFAWCFVGFFKLLAKILIFLSRYLTRSKNK